MAKSIVSLVKDGGMWGKTVLVACPRCHENVAAIAENVSTGTLKIWCPDCAKYSKITDGAFQKWAETRVSNMGNTCTVEEFINRHNAFIASRKQRLAEAK